MKKGIFCLLLFWISVSVFAETSNPKNVPDGIVIKPEYIIGILTAIITILGSGVVAAWISHRLAKGKEELFYKRKKLEELYKCIERYTTLIFSMNHMWLKVMDGELSYNQGLDLQINGRDDEEKHHLPEIDMLINLYFPSFRDTYKEFLKKRDVVNRLHGEFRDVYKLKGPTVEYSQNRKKFSNALLEIDKASSILLEEIVGYAQKLNCLK
jgi:hypothetical protein